MDNSRQQAVLKTKAVTAWISRKHTPHYPPTVGWLVLHLAHDNSNNMKNLIELSR